MPDTPDREAECGRCLEVFDREELTRFGDYDMCRKCVRECCGDLEQVKRSRKVKDGFWER